MIDLQINAKHIYKVPQSWGELSRAQLLAYAQLVYPRRKKIFAIDGDSLVVAPGMEEEYERMCFGMLYHILSMPSKEFYQLSGQAVYDLIHIQGVLSFLFTTCDLEQNMIADIKISPKLVLCGPREFHHLSFEEFSLADRAYVDFIMDSKEQDLDLLIAHLYRKVDAGYDPQTSADPREPFNEVSVHGRATALCDVAIEEKIAGMLWYESQRNAFIRQHAELFDSGSSLAEVSLADVILNLSNGLENYDLVRRSSILLVTADVRRVIRDLKTRQQAAKSHAPDSK